MCRLPQVIAVCGQDSWRNLGDEDSASLQFCGSSFFFRQRHVASARSFNSYPSLLQMRLIIEFTQGPMLVTSVDSSD